MGAAPGGQQAGPARGAVRDRRRELGAFLRSRRARLRPADVGLAEWGVRRVPGLRREEVAQLASVGLTWYTWLEQGRQARPSASVLTAIADALRLDVHEREHLFALARDPDDQARGAQDQARGAQDQARGAQDQARGAQDQARTAGPGLDTLVQGFEPAPAYAISARFDVLAHNRSAGLLFGDLGPGPGGPANLLNLGFTDPSWRTLIADWEQEAARHVAMYRAAMTLHFDDPAWTVLPARLARLSPDFARFWASSDVAGPERRLKRFRHPDAGPLTLYSTSLLMADDPMIRIVILYPAAASDAAKLDRIASVLLRLRGRSRGRGQRRRRLLGRGGQQLAHVELGPDHLLEHEVVIEVQDGAGFGGDHRVAAEAELVILLLLPRQRPVGGALYRVDAVNDDDLQV
jgi:transcriptional regulator with XRE-family HTH domain